MKRINEGSETFFKEKHLAWNLIAQVQCIGHEWLKFHRVTGMRNIQACPMYLIAADLPVLYHHFYIVIGFEFKEYNSLPDSIKDLQKNIDDHVWLYCGDSIPKKIRDYVKKKISNEEIMKKYSTISTATQKNKKDQDDGQKNKTHVAKPSNETAVEKNTKHEVTDPKLEKKINKTNEDVNTAGTESKKKECLNSEEKILSPKITQSITTSEKSKISMILTTQKMILLSLLNHCHQVRIRNYLHQMMSKLHLSPSKRMIL